MNTLQSILKSKASIYGVDFDAKERTAIYKAMVQYAARQVAEYHNREIKSVGIGGIRLLLSLKWDNIVLWIRQKSFNLAKKKAQHRANTEIRKIYVIRNSMIGYSILSTFEVNQNKKLRILKKDIDAMKLHEVADFIAYPKKR